MAVDFGGRVDRSQLLSSLAFWIRGQGWLWGFPQHGLGSFGVCMEGAEGAACQWCLGSSGLSLLSCEIRCVEFPSQQAPGGSRVLHSHGFTPGLERGTPVSCQVCQGLLGITLGTQAAGRA